MNPDTVRAYLLTVCAQPHHQYIDRYIQDYTRDCGLVYWTLHQPDDDLHQEFLMYLGKLEADGIITL